MKLMLECPCCHGKEVLQMDNLLTPERIRMLTRASDYCKVCKKAGLGDIPMAVKHFDWEAKIAATGESKVPTHVDTEKLTPEELARIKERESALIERDVATDS